MEKSTVDDIVEKYCPKCKDFWPADKEFFYSDKSSRDGLYQWCIACYLEYRHKRHPLKGINGFSLSEFRERNKRIFDMRNSGSSFTDIGDIFGIKRQRAHQIYKREFGRKRYE